MNIYKEILEKYHDFVAKFETKPTKIYLGFEQWKSIHDDPNRNKNVRKGKQRLEFAGLQVYQVAEEDHINLAY